MNPQDAPHGPAPGGEESPAERTARLLAEASAAARENIDTLVESLARTVEHAAQVTDGGEVYPAPIRYLCRLICEEASIRRGTLIALTAKSFSQDKRQKS